MVIDRSRQLKLSRSTWSLAEAADWIGVWSASMSSVEIVKGCRFGRVMRKSFRTVEEDDRPLKRGRCVPGVEIPFVIWT